MGRITKLHYFNCSTMTCCVMLPLMLLLMMFRFWKSSGKCWVACTLVPTLIKCVACWKCLISIFCFFFILFLQLMLNLRFSSRFMFLSRLWFVSFLFFFFRWLLVAVIRNVAAKVEGVLQQLQKQQTLKQFLVSYSPSQPENTTAITLRPSSTKRVTSTGGLLLLGNHFLLFPSLLLMKKFIYLYKMLLSSFV